MMTVAQNGKSAGMQQKDPAKLLKEIFDLDLQQCEVSVCLASTRPHNDVPGYRRINLSQKMGDEFRKAINSAIEPFKKGTVEKNIVVHDYAADNVQVENVIEYLDITDYENAITEQIAPLADYKGLDHFEQSDKAFSKNLRFYVLLIQPPQGPVISFYRKYSHTQILQESTQFGMHLLHNDLYDSIVEPTFLFDRHIDCIGYDNHMFILQKSNFYGIFDFTAALEELAKKTLEFLRLKDYIHNFERFADDCKGNKIKLLKLKNISMQPYLQTLTVDDMEQNINTYDDDVDIEIKIINGKKKLLYDHKKPWEILHLLDDMYSESSMTKTSYQMRGKRPIGKRGARRK
jgi:Domain of unknown function (DUF4868)